MCRYGHLQGSWSQFLLGDNIEPEYGVSLRQTWGTSRPKIYTLNSKLSRKLFMGRSLLYLYTDHYFEKIKPVSYDNFNLCALKLLRWCMSYLRELGCPSLLAGSFLNSEIQCLCLGVAPIRGTSEYILQGVC